MPRRLRRTIIVLSVLALGVLGLPVGPASAQTYYAPDDYCLGQCADLLPPGQNGNATLVDILGNQAFGTMPAHTGDQLAKYAGLISGYTGLTNDQIGAFFNDASFGVPAGQAQSTISPRADVTIVRDRATGVPHVTGTTRAGTMFGAGYAGAQDRLWVMDLLRHVGRFVGMLAYKAARYGRTLVRIGRWFPSSKLCSACGTVAESMPPNVRGWACPCGAVHDRDLNAAINILAAGRADRMNACGARVRPGPAPAQREEAGSRRGAA